MRYRQIRIESVYFADCGLRERSWVSRRTNHHVLWPTFTPVDIEGRRGFEPVLMHVSDYANDRQPTRLRIERTDIEAFSNRITVGEKSLRDGFVHYDGLAGVIVCIQQPTHAQWNTHGCKIARARTACFRDGAPSVGRKRLTFHHES